jgi:hypothetical protein
MPMGKTKKDLKNFRSGLARVKRNCTGLLPHYIIRVNNEISMDILLISIGQLKREKNDE